MSTQDKPKMTPQRSKQVFVPGWSSVRRVAVLALAGVALTAWAAEPVPVGKPTVLEDSGEVLKMFVGRSKALTVPWEVKRVAVTEPETAEVEVLEPDQLLVLGITSGSTDLTVWGTEGQVWQTQVLVKIDIEKFNEDLDALFPGADVDVTNLQDIYFVKGTVKDVDQVEQLHAFLEAAELEYVDMTRLPGLQQVMVKIRFAEADRAAMRSLGFSAVYHGETTNALDPAHFVGGTAIGPEGTPLVGSLIRALPLNPNNPSVTPFEIGSGGGGGLVTLMGALSRENLELYLQALEQDEYVRILAEPNLVCLSGEDASFLAGGEIPVPIPQSTGGGVTITVEYREYGIRLNVTPTVEGDGTIRLRVAPEVSSLTDVGAIEIQGFPIQALLTRRAESTVVLKSGQSFALAGLLDNNVNARNAQIPLLGDLPVLGALFRSVRYQERETELLVLVTAELVEPMANDEDFPLPGDLHTTPSDWELFAMGRLDGTPRSGKRASDIKELDVEGLKELKGPGAWATYPNEYHLNAPSWVPKVGNAD